MLVAKPTRPSRCSPRCDSLQSVRDVPTQDPARFFCGQFKLTKQTPFPNVKRRLLKATAAFASKFAGAPMDAGTNEDWSPLNSPDALLNLGFQCGVARPPGQADDVALFILAFGLVPVFLTNGGTCHFKLAAMDVPMISATIHSTTQTILFPIFVFGVVGLVFLCSLDRQCEVQCRRSVCVFVKQERCAFQVCIPLTFSSEQRALHGDCRSRN